MKHSDELRKNKEVLELEIKKLINDFVENNGQCEVKIETEYSYHEYQPNKIRLVGSNVNIHLNIK